MGGWVSHKPLKVFYRGDSGLDNHAVQIFVQVVKEEVVEFHRILLLVPSKLRGNLAEHVLEIGWACDGACTALAT
jgi:hypothetical protein